MIEFDNQPANSSEQNDDPNKKKKRGRGWFGNSERHAEAGRKGGRARRKAASQNQ